MMSPRDARPLRLAVTGREGQLAHALAERGPEAGCEVILLGRPTLDLSQPDTIAQALRAVRPDAVVNAAAYTAVDKAETESNLAEVVNAAGAGAVAEVAADLAIPIVQVSTDYVFDGTAAEPYREEAPTAPLNVYGRSKLAGEAAVMAATADHVILRTAWVYSAFGSNFVRTMLRLAETRPEVGVVADQHGCPTNALDMADGICRIVHRLVTQPDDKGLRGIFHFAGSSETDWAAFAEAVFAASSARGGPTATVKRIATADYPTLAGRPANSRLDCAKLARTYGVCLPPFEDTLPDCVARLIEKGRT